MKEAIANLGVFNLIITFVIILLAFFIGSLSYTKAFKVKNKIVEEIEKDKGYFTDITEPAVEDWLSEIGYRMNTGFNSYQCPLETYNGINGTVVNTSSDYQYCVYKFDSCEGKITDKKKCSIHYRVVAYMYFDVPIINNLVKIPVKGETVSITTLDS